MHHAHHKQDDHQSPAATKAIHAVSHSHPDGAGPAVVPMFHHEVQRVLAVPQACALEPAALVQTGQDQRDTGGPQDHVLRTGNAASHGADQDIAEIEKRSTHRPDQEITQRKEKRAAELLRCPLPINRSMEQKRRIARWEHHGHHHHQPHACKDEKAGEAGPPFHSKRHGHSHFHQETHVLSAGPGQRPGRRSEDGDDDK